MPITNFSFEKIAKEILKSIKTNSLEISKNSFNNSIYNLLTSANFDVKFYQTELIHYRHEFNRIKDSISVKPYGNVITNPAWFSLVPFKGDKEFNKSDSFFGFSVTHKLYFSLLLPSGPAKKIMSEIFRFYKYLPDLFLNLYRLSYSVHSKISFKVPNTIGGFLAHHDTLVVHFKNKAFSQKINELVLTHFNKYDFHSKQRHHRVDKGFDFADNVFNKHSHSQLIAMILSEHIFNHKNSVEKLSVKQISIWLQKSLESINSWDEKTFARKLQDSQH